NVDLELVVRHANESLAEYQPMRNWTVWPDEDFPRTSTQKPRGNVIQQVVLSKMGNPPTAGVSSTSLSLSELITRVTGRSTGNSAREANLETDLNLSSLDRVERMGPLQDPCRGDWSE